MAEYKCKQRNFAFANSLFTMAKQRSYERQVRMGIKKGTVPDWSSAFFAYIALIISLPYNCGYC